MRRRRAALAFAGAVTGLTVVASVAGCADQQTRTDEASRHGSHGGETGSDGDSEGHAGHAEEPRDHPARGCGLERGRRRLPPRHDRPPPPGDRDERPRRRARLGPRSTPARRRHRRRAGGRDPHHGGVAGAARPAGARARGPRPPPDARDAHRRPDGRPRRGVRAGVRRALPHRHGAAPSRRRGDGRGPGRARASTPSSSTWPPRSSPDRPPRSSACATCSRAEVPRHPAASAVTTRSCSRRIPGRRGDARSGRRSSRGEPAPRSRRTGPQRWRAAARARRGRPSAGRVPPGG